MKKLLFIFSLTALLSSCAEVVVKEVSIVPQPQKVEVTEGNFPIKNNQVIAISDGSLSDAAAYLTKVLSATGFDFSVESGSGDINLVLGGVESKTEGAYTLNVDKSGVTINANEYKGIINGITTLRQLLPVEIEANSAVEGFGWALPYVNIVDEPAYEWRGLMLDVSRHFYTKAEVLEFVDLLALYKMNKFHWHLTDDQGWRIEIKKYPLLTEKGGWRKFNDQDLQCIRLAKENSNSDFELPEDRIKIVEGDTLYGGFYTQEDIKEIVAYAGKYGIDVVPEIDMPGHCLCALENYKGLSCSENTGWMTVFSSPLCPGKESAMNFAKDVYKEVFGLFPYEYVHLGADEVDMTNWKTCKDCQKLMRENNLKDVHDLHAWFVTTMENYFNENGKKLIGWDEIIEGNVSPTATVAWWRDWVPAAKQATEMGHPVILCPTSYFYFDYGQNERTIEALYKGDVTTKLTSEEKKLIKGYQANIWCERIPTRERMHFQVFPRALAVAEKAWSSSENQSWESFQPRLADQWDRLTALDVNYRIDRLAKDIDRSVFIDSFTVTFDCLDKNAVVRYTEDGTIPTSESTLYTGPFEITESKDFIVGTFHSTGNRSDIHKIKITKVEYSDAIEKEGTTAGLNVEFWDNYRGKTSVEITEKAADKKYEATEFALPEVIEGHFATIFTGYLNIPADDIYTFEILARDGAVLKIADQLVVDNDGRHPALTRRGQAALKAGLHAVELRNFGGKVAELSVKIYNSKGEELKVSDLVCK